MDYFIINIYMVFNDIKLEYYIVIYKTIRIYSNNIFILYIFTVTYG